MEDRDWRECRGILVKAAQARLQRPLAGDAAYAPFPLTDEQCVEILRVDRALQRMPENWVRMAQAMEMRYFAGMAVEEIAMRLGAAVRSVKRDLHIGEGWMLREMGDDA